MAFDEIADFTSNFEIASNENIQAERRTDADNPASNA
jgi:hypothetical protein